MRYLVVALMLFSFSAVADGLTIYKTIPGTGVRDYSSGGYQFDSNRGTLQPTLPGTSVRDYSKPGYRIEGNKAYPTLPGTNVRDYSKPGFVFE